MSPAWFGCADRARLRDDPMIGSAPQAGGWLLIEHPGPWGVDALAESGIEREVLLPLSSAARDTRWRILLIRRPGRRDVSTANRTWMAVGPSQTVRGTWRTGADLGAGAEAIQRLAEPVGAAGPVASAEPPGSLEHPRARQRDPVILVCAHGTHDTCCAVRGRPVAAALAQRWPLAVWECSHLGGDRFAANVVVLPDAAYYGNLGAQSAVQAVQEHLAGRLAVDWLRGLARFPPVAQVAIAEAHRRLGPMAPSAVGAGVPQQLAPHRWQVPVTTSAGEWRATVVAERREPAVLTCRAPAATPAAAYRVVDFRPAQPWPAAASEPAD